MQLLDLTLATPEENLACDEALLELCEESDAFEVLRFWEAPEPFVVLGRSNELAEHVDIAACRAAGLRVLRRGSGGGSVVQGPGCLSYAVVLRVDRDPRLGSIDGAFRFVLERHAVALEAQLRERVSIKGVSDLVAAGRKFSGNAQRRLLRTVLVHGTILHGLDLALMGRCLLPPSRQPAYRAGRPHAEFVANVSLDPQLVRQALTLAWGVRQTLSAVPHAEIAAFAQARYVGPPWTVCP